MPVHVNWIIDQHIFDKQKNIQLTAYFCGFIGSSLPVFDCSVYCIYIAHLLSAFIQVLCILWKYWNRNIEPCKPLLDIHIAMKTLLKVSGAWERS